MGKSTINGKCSIAMLVYQREITIIQSSQKTNSKPSPHQSAPTLTWTASWLRANRPFRLGIVNYPNPVSICFHHLHCLSNLPSGSQTWQWTTHQLEIDDCPSYKPPFLIGDFPNSHVWWHHRVSPICVDLCIISITFQIINDIPMLCSMIYPVIIDIPSYIKLPIHPERCGSCLTSSRLRGFQCIPKIPSRTTHSFLGPSQNQGHPIG